MKTFQIAIDGPAGAGKSTIAGMVAKQKQYIYVDTGAMYRAVALYLIENNIAGDDHDRIVLACKNINITIEYMDGEQAVLLNGKNVNAYIRTPEVSAMASLSSKDPAIREHLKGIQKQLANTHSVVMDGRDIGTVILPNADVKIFLTASVEVRAKRRYDEMVAKKMECDFEALKTEIAKRDKQDMEREIAPLKQAEDAVLLDSSDMTISEVTDRILEICNNKGM